MQQAKLTKLIKIEHWIELVNKRKVNCGLCPPHHNENATGNGGDHKTWKRHRKTKYRA
jgi:hypothetical protein